MGKRTGVACLAVFAVLVACSPVRADSLVTTDGRTLTGKVVHRSVDKITFEIRCGSSSMRMDFPLEKVAKLTEGADEPAPAAPAVPAVYSKPAAAPAPALVVPAVVQPALPKPAVYEAPAAPPAAVAAAQDAQPLAPLRNAYFTIPIRGEIGLYVTADQVRQGLAMARKARAGVVVLEVDSGGGSTEECARIVELLADAQKDTRIVAYVKRAISAAAIVSVACKEIYVDERAVIGGALAFQMLPDGTPADVEEKMQSIWRATCRTAAETGGHQPLLAEAMMDLGIGLSIITKDGKPRVEEGDAGTVLKRKGKLLTMTAKETLASGLADGQANCYDGLGVRLGMSGWKSAGREAEELHERNRKEVDAGLKKLEQLETTFNTQISKARDGSSRQEVAASIAGAVATMRQIHDLSKRYPQLGLRERELADGIRALLDQREQVLKGK